jgi:3-phosphoshikimate 1-carboxyvinyltransferase
MASDARALPDLLPVAPRGPLDAEVRVPGSKSISNRALLVAALAEGESRLEGLQASQDIDVMRSALTALGAGIARDEAAGPDAWSVAGTGGRLRAPTATLDVRASGTAVRFLLGVASLVPGTVLVDGTPRLRERPVADVADALGRLGAQVEILGRAGCPPVRVRGGSLEGGTASVDARRSSQTVSSLLLVAPYARKDVRLELVEGALVSRRYVDVTLAVMCDFGARAAWSAPGVLEVRAGATYAGRRYTIEPDASAAVYPLCAAAIAGGRVRVPGLAGNSRQADVALLEVLERMGCRVLRDTDAVEVSGPEDGLRGVEADLNAFPDAAVALAVVAAFADGPTCIRNVAHMRIKETDRLAALETELRKLGCGAHADADSLRIEPGPLHGAEIDTYDDHRMAMAFALAGLKLPGVAIRDPGCAAKSWPNYFEVLERLSLRGARAPIE